MEQAGNGAMSVRARARNAMKAEVAEVALGLFLAEGFEQTTVEQIAQAAGMSRATFFRYFRTKEDVVLDQAIDFGTHIHDALVARPQDEPLWTALRRALDPAVEAQTHHVDRAVRMLRMMNQTPSLRARHHEKTMAWQHSLKPEVARRLTRDATTPPPAQDPRPAALVASALGCLDAALDLWSTAPTKIDLANILDTAMHAVRPI